SGPRCSTEGRFVLPSGVACGGRVSCLGSSPRGHRFDRFGADEGDRRMQLGAIRVLAALCCLPLLTTAIPAHAAPTATMWQIVRSPVWDLNVRSIERRTDPLPAVDGQAPVRPVGRFALFVVDLTNRTDRLLAPQTGDFVLWSAEGARSLNLGELPAAR